MTAGGDFIPSDQGFDVGPDYPVIFGLRLTPAIQGVLIALLGLLGAGAVLYYLVLPEWTRYQELTAQVNQAEVDVQQQEEVAKKIEQARKDLEVAQQQNREVLKLFANEDALDTLLLDLNRQVDARNADLARRREQKLAQCPAIIRRNLRDFEDQAGPLAVKAEMRTYTPVREKNPIISDSSYGTGVNGKLKRQVVTVELTGNYNQTSAILQSIERLQPLLVIRDLQSTLDQKSRNFVPLSGASGCAPEPRINTSFQLEALLPLTPQESAQAAPKPAQPNQ